MTARKTHSPALNGFSTGSSDPAKRDDKTKVQKRVDGEMYARPVPDPFTPEWMDGYDDAQTGQSRTLPEQGGKNRNQNYHDGWVTGQHDLEVLDEAGSSNA